MYGSRMNLPGRIPNRSPEASARELAKIEAQFAKEAQELAEETALEFRRALKKIRRTRFLTMYRSFASRKQNLQSPSFEEFYSQFDAWEPVCGYCQRGVQWDQISLDHRQPISRGGSLWEAENLILACKDCNMLKGSLTEEEFRFLVGDRLLEFLERFKDADWFWKGRRWRL